FTFKANNGVGDSNVAMISLTITPVNDAPVAKDARYLIPVSSNLFGRLVATDVDGDAVTFSITRPPRRGVARILDPAIGTFRFTPDMGVRGTDSFIFTAIDASGRTDSARVMIVITRCGC